MGEKINIINNLQPRESVKKRDQARNDNRGQYRENFNN